MARKKSDVIVSNIRFDDSKENAFKILFDSDSPPVITSIGYVGLPGTNRYVSYVIKSKGREITHIEVSEPDLRLIAEDEAKINFVDKFMPGEE